MLLSGNDIRPTVFSAIAVLLAIASAPSADELVQFDRDIRPIFANHCIKCHGRDEGRRKAGLALDSPDSAVRKLESGATDFAETVCGQSCAPGADCGTIPKH